MPESEPPVTAHRAEVQRDTYVDSVKLMAVSRSMQDADGVSWATAVMATPANLELLRDAGFPCDELTDVDGNDLVLAAAAASDEQAGAALDVAHAAIRGAGDGPGRPGEESDAAPRSTHAAITRLPAAAVALVSVPGPYAELEAYKALEQGLHVLLFSDNVPLEAEIALKDAARSRGLLLMGPGAGTAVLDGVGLGFANQVRRGPVRIVAAAGTGAQEAMTLLHRWGSGVSHVVGVGGRDVTDDVAGRMLRTGIGARTDREERALLIVSKPPDPAVARALLGELAGRPAVCAFLGLEEPQEAPEGVTLARTIEDAVLAVLDHLGLERPDPGAGLAATAAEAAAGLPATRTAVRGVFSGGTLCYESMVVLSSRLGAVHSNTPLRPGWGLPAPAGAHVCLDLGEEEYTRGRPHPMIDPLARADELRRAADDPTTAVVLLDVVLGYGAHADPAGELAPVLAEIVGRQDGPAVVAYVLGTDEDPQDASRQTAVLRDAGALVGPTAARTALLSAAIAARTPELTKERP